MRRTTISIQDDSYKKIKMYADKNKISFSSAITELSKTGINSKTVDEIAAKIIKDFSDNNVEFYVVGNFSIPSALLTRALRSAINFDNSNLPLIEFREIVGG